MSADGGAPVVGSLFGAGGALMESSDKASAYEAQANEYSQNAKVERETGAYNVMRQQIAAGKKFGAISTDYAASGVSADSGSAMAVLAGSHVNSEYDRLSILHGSDMRAGIMDERARQDMSAADRSRQMGYFNAFSAIFGGAAKAGMNNSGPETKDVTGEGIDKESSYGGNGYGGGMSTNDRTYFDE